MKIFNSVAQMKLATIKAGQYVETFGYYTKGDGAQARYLVTAGVSPDDSVSPDLANGNHALYQGVGAVNDLSQAYIFDTVAEFKASLIEFPIGKQIYVKEISTGNGGGEIYNITLTSTVTPDDIKVFQSTEIPTKSIVQSEYGQIKGDITKQYVKVAGVIRNTGAGWFFITDSGHNNIRFGAITTNVDGTVTIQNPPNCKTIGSVLVGPDETYTKIGITAGSSVSLVETVITFAAPLNALIDTSTAPPTILTASHFLTNGVGISRLTGQINSSNIALNHPQKAGGSNVSASLQSSDDKKYMNIGVSYLSNTTTAFYFTKDIYGYCFYDGAAWQLLSEKGVVVPTWSVDTLTLTHNLSSGNLDRQLTGRYPYSAHLDSISDTVTKVKFTDIATGTLQTTEDTNMRFTYHIGDVNPILGGAVVDPIGNIIVTGDNVQVNANDLINASGNFWIEGIFEV